MRDSPASSALLVLIVSSLILGPVVAWIPLQPATQLNLPQQRLLARPATNAAFPTRKDARRIVQRMSSSNYESPESPRYGEQEKLFVNREFSSILDDASLLQAAGPWDDRIAQFNSITLSGRIGNDPELRYLESSGKVVLNLSLAVRRRYHWMERAALQEENTNEDGYLPPETDWFNLELWGQTAEFAAKYIEKGARLGVTGSFQVDSWMDRETMEPRSKPKIVVRDFSILETKAEADLRRRRTTGNGGGGWQQNGPQSRGGPSYSEYDGGNDFGSAGTGSFF